MSVQWGGLPGIATVDLLGRHDDVGFLEAVARRCREEYASRYKNKLKYSIQ